MFYAINTPSFNKIACAKNPQSAPTKRQTNFLILFIIYREVSIEVSRPHRDKFI